MVPSPFFYTVVAGLSTGLGGVLAAAVRPSRRALVRAMSEVKAAPVIVSGTATPYSRALSRALSRVSETTVVLLTCCAIASRADSGVAEELVSDTLYSVGKNSVQGSGARRSVPD